MALILHECSVREAHVEELESSRKFSWKIW